MTVTTVRVLEEFVSDPDVVRYGLELMTLTGYPSGTIFPILARLEGLGWLASGWEDVDPSTAGRPRRRYYRLTGEGRQAARTALARVEAERRRRMSSLRPARGTAAGAT
jgi:DNA-binding PadR family transcriptional regulator